ncbi:hypothetical protein GCM10027275_50830 [Rhabdobacter roseus]|uniref:2TM domain-containing protein n=1 Tax=Rhabdobacter roseus TaxID=1655419 RepID=A0A840TS24_9BACT|nr:2TM domain-containing protein [Rhabdobacter roseus]MBB5287156.1 hypothetical protein [Rhabdobacter roseus]
MESTNEKLWRIARQRARVKNNAISYLIVNTFLIGIWYFSSGYSHFFWPMFPLIFWGMGLGFEYYHAYHDNGGVAEREYQKLLKEEERSRR